MASHEMPPNFIEVTQQDLQELVDGDHDEDLQHALDRSCTPHCAEVLAELTGRHLDSVDRLDEYVDFLRTHGSAPDMQADGELYNVNDGWYSVAIADLLRINGFNVVLQRMQYSPQDTDISRTLDSGRVRSDDELKMFEGLARHGGGDSSRWLSAVTETRSAGGYAIVSLRIPSSKVPNTWGQHSVLVTGIDEANVTYFDPDKLAVDRYGDSASDQLITRVDDSKLIYTQPVGAFTSRMTGEVMHVVPAT